MINHTYCPQVFLHTPQSDQTDIIGLDGGNSKQFDVHYPAVLLLKHL